MTAIINKLKISLEENNLDALLLIPGSNFRYFTGGNFHLTERPIIIIVSKNYRTLVIIPSLEVESFKLLGFDAEIISWNDRNGFIESFYKVSKKLGKIGTIGVEGQKIRFFEINVLQKVFPKSKIIDANSVLTRFRIIKEKKEIDLIKSAIKISEKTLEETINHVKVGKTEKEIKNILIQNLYKNGSEGLAFEPIVLASKNSSLPHGRSTDYEFKKGDALLFDFGAIVEGYNADITRTFFIGEVSEYQKQFYETVLSANLEALKKCKEGVSINDVDDTATKILENSDYKKFIVHKTGHGLGLDVHEEPYIGRGNMKNLVKGMVITIEPGLYNPNLLGVRIEDDVHITNNEPEILTSFSKDLIIL